MQHKCCLDQTAHREKNPKEAATSQDRGVWNIHLQLFVGDMN